MRKPPHTHTDNTHHTTCTEETINEKKGEGKKREGKIWRKRETERQRGRDGE